MTIELKPNPSAEELEALQKRVKALKRKAYDECTEEIHRMCATIYQVHIEQYPNQETRPEARYCEGQYVIRIVDDGGGGDAFIIGDYYNEVTQQALPSTLHHLAQWRYALVDKYKSAETWLEMQRKAQIEAQYGELLKEIKRMGDELPEAFVAEFKVGDEIVVEGNDFYKGKILTITAIDCDSAEYDAWYWDQPHYTHQSEQKAYTKIPFWWAKATQRVVAVE